MSPKGSNLRNRPRFPCDGRPALTNRENGDGATGSGCRARGAGQGRRPARHLRKILAVPGILLAVVTLAGSCGLETIPYLAPPGPPTVVGPNRISFTHDYIDDDPSIFEGYEFYYRLYDSLSSSQLTNDKITVDSATTPGLSQIPAGYRPLLPDIQYGISPTLPLVSFSATEKTQPTKVIVDLGNGTDATITWDTNTLTVKRNDGPDPNNSSKYKDFYAVSQYDPGDADIPTDVTTIDKTTTVMGLIVLAYGVDYNSLSAVYSVPTFLQVLYFSNFPIYSP